LRALPPHFKNDEQLTIRLLQLQQNERNSLMDSILTTVLTVGVGKIFSRGCISGFSQVYPKIFFQGGKVGKIHFTHSKLRKQPFFAKKLIGKCHISKPKGGIAPLPSPSDAQDLG